MTTVLKKLSPFFLMTILVMMGCKKEHFNFNDLAPTVVSFFTLDKTSFDVDEDIQFTNKSEDADTYTWNFGDGTTSTEKNPLKKFTEPGSYTVSLRAIGPGGTGNYSVVITIIDNSSHGTEKELFFIEYGKKLIEKISLNPGSTAEQVADIANKAGVGIAYDSVNKKIYFTDFENGADGKIWWMNLDGSNMEAIVSGITNPYSITVNLKGGKIYWADDAGNISRANLDGSGLERSFINIPDGMMRGISYDSKNDIIYFYEVNFENLYAAKSDGTGVAKIIQGAYGYSLRVDEVNSKLYYEDRKSGSIMQSNLDGSGIVKIVAVPNTRIFGMAIDNSENKFYWSDRDKGAIYRSNLDGTSPEVFLGGLKSPRGIFIK